MFNYKFMHVLICFFSFLTLSFTRLKKERIHRAPDRRWYVKGLVNTHVKINYLISKFAYDFYKVLIKSSYLYANMVTACSNVVTSFYYRINKINNTGDVASAS